MRIGALFLLSIFSGSANSANNEVNNVLNNVSGSVSNVTINQSATVSQEQIESEQKLNRMIGEAQEILSNKSLSEVKKSEAGKVMTFTAVANEVNKMNATKIQKNSLCKSRVDVSASVLGFDVDFGYKNCDKAF